MTYAGEVHNGVVVLKDAPRLEEGTRVRVEVEPAKVPRGSPEAILNAIAHTSNSWAESAAEMDDALEYLRRTKWDEVRRQQAEPEPGL
jgi:hypothetical protein